MSELVAEHIRFNYPGAKDLFEDVNLNVKAGERVAIIGDNGSGKSTLLQIIAGLLAPTTGQVTLDGLPIAEQREMIGLLFQNPDHQMIASTVEEEIALGMELRGIDPAKIRTEVDQILRRFRIEDLQNKSPESLSGGQKQRVALVAVMISRPRFLLLDEPDSYLDATSRRDLLNSLEEYCADCALLWVVSKAKSLPRADRYYQLLHGRLEPTSPTRIL